MAKPKGKKTETMKPASIYQDAEEVLDYIKKKADKKNSKWHNVLKNQIN